MEIPALREIRFRLFKVVAIAMSLTACAVATSIPSEPFVAFERSVAQLKVSADAALATEQQIVYERYLAQWRATGIVEDLQLQTSEMPAPFSMQLEGAILFKDIERARSTLSDMTSLVLRYAGMLIMLVGSAEDSVAIDADTVAEELRTNATTLAARLGKEDAISNGYFFGFGVLAEVYLESRRQDALTELIHSSQAEIEAFAEAAQQLCMASGMGIQAEYATAFSKLTAAAAGMSESQRKDVISSILELNDETLRQLDTLRLVHDAYGALPSAHRNLARAASGSASFTELLTYAETLKKRYEAFSEE